MIDKNNDPASVEDSVVAKDDNIEKLQQELQDTKAKCEEYLNGWKRERADFLNYKKEEMERIGQLVQYSQEELILKIIPILDNIYLAESHVPEELKTHQWITGFNHIKTQLEKFLKEEGIEPIEVLSKPFDANVMEIIGESEGEESNVVTEESQRGYTLNGKILRVAKVKISK